MCYYVDVKYTRKEILEAFNVEVNFKNFEFEKMVSGYRPKGYVDKKIPVITDMNPGEVVLGDWGLVADWQVTRAFQRQTLNARIEELAEKKSYRSYVQKRCLVLVNGFYEWRTLNKSGEPDPNGKIKQLHHIKLDNGGKPFALAGIYNIWNNREKDDELLTFSICTTEANTLMADIHNTKKRMPVTLREKDYDRWLNESDYLKFAHPNYDAQLIFENLETNKIPPSAPTQTTLF